MNTISEPHTIYFDPDDAEMDGLGWNVVGDWDSAVAARFATRDEAGRYCETMGIAAHDDLPCECGKTIGIHTVNNGMYHMPVCDACWMDPENIAVEVCVATAAHALATRLPHDVPAAELPTSVLMAMSDAFCASLAARGIKDDGTIVKVVTARWDEWYAA